MDSKQFYLNALNRAIEGEKGNIENVETLKAIKHNLKVWSKRDESITLWSVAYKVYVNWLKANGYLY